MTRVNLVPPRNQENEMNAQVRYDPATLPAVLRAQFDRFGGLTLAELEMLSEMRGVPATAGMFDEPLDVSAMIQAFEIAVSRGAVRQPQVDVMGFKFKYATRGNTPGAIFVIEADMGFDEYLGKIYQGKFMPVRACTPEQEKRILAAAANPLEAIIAFGKQTGRCGICRRTLTDAKSVELGIGPICKGKFGL